MKNTTILWSLLLILILPFTALAQKQSPLKQGKKLYNSGEYEAAIPYLEKAVENKPKKNEAHYLLGMAYLKTGKPAKAETSFTNALELKESYNAALVGRAEAFIAQEKYDQALADLNKVLETDSANIDAQYQIGTLYYKKSNFEPAALAFEKVIAARPKDAMTHYQLGLTYYRLKKYDKTIFHFETFLQLCPECEEADQVKKILISLKG